MKRLAIILSAAVALAISGAAYAQTETPEKLALARQMIQIVNLPQMMEGMTSMMGTMQKSVLAKLPTAEQQKMEIYQNASNEELKQVFIPKLIDQMSHVYAQTFSVDELRGILAFYQSPTGKALLAKTPEVMKAFYPQIMIDVPDFMRGTFKRYCAETPCTAQEHAAFDKILANFPAAKP